MLKRRKRKKVKRKCGQEEGEKGRGGGGEEEEGKKQKEEELHKAQQGETQIGRGWKTLFPFLCSVLILLVRSSQTLLSALRVQSA